MASRGFGSNVNGDHNAPLARPIRSGHLVL
jgi:hypothetical protein